MHDVIQVAGSFPLRQRSDFFREDLFEAIAQNMNPGFRAIRIRVMNLPLYRRQHQLFLARQVELDARKTAPLLNWTYVIHPALGIFPTGNVDNIEANLIDRYLDTACFIYPF